MVGVASNPVKTWETKTENLLGFCGIGFAAILVIIYEISGQGAALRQAGHAGGYAVWTYLAFCIVRLVWVTQSEALPLFGWVTAGIDVVALSVILYVFGGQTSDGTPVYTFYYALIAMHAMRLNSILVLSLGVLSILASVLLGATQLTAPPELTANGSVASTTLFPGTEVEKLLSLMMFVVLTAIGVLRARALLTDAGQKESAEIRMHEYRRQTVEKTELMATFGKDMKGPMTDVSEMVEALKGTKLSPQQIKLLNVIEKSGGEILSIIDDIVDYTDLELGELQIQNNEFNLRSFVEQTIESLAEKARSKSLDVLTHISAGAPDLILADEARLKKVLLNLVDNAITHTETGGVYVRVTCTPVDGKVASLSVSVSDTGTGISEDRRELIFAPAARPSGSKKNRYGVMGLGLSVSRGIIRANGGDILLESEVGQGSNFSFEIRVPYRFLSNQNEKPFKAIASLNKVQVLIIDDIPQSADLLETKLNSLGFMPKIVTSAEAACTAIMTAYNAKKPIKFVLVDYGMPDWTGLQLAKLIRTRSQLDQMGIIAMSASDKFGLEADFDKVGVTAYLRKPFKEEDLQYALLKALRLPDVVISAPIQGFEGRSDDAQKSA